MACSVHCLWDDWLCVGGPVVSAGVRKAGAAAGAAAARRQRAERSARQDPLQSLRHMPAPVGHHSCGDKPW